MDEQNPWIIKDMYGTAISSMVDGEYEFTMKNLLKSALPLDMVLNNETWGCMTVNAPIEFDVLPDCQLGAGYQDHPERRVLNTVYLPGLLTASEIWILILKAFDLS